MLRWLRWWIPLIAASGSCKGDRPAGGDVQGDADADVDSDTDTDTDTDPSGPALVERPLNPTCIAPDRPTIDADVAVTRIFPSLTFDSAMQALQPPDDPDHWWVVLQEGQIVRFDDDPSAASTTLVVDLSSKIDAVGNEKGLLSIAFHPDWATNRDVIVSYTAPGPTSVLERYHSPDGGVTLDLGSAQQILTQAQPFSNHKGGLAAFGPDGYLYFGFGDGGSGGDPFENGQNLGTLLGKMIRIDVDQGAPYAIPADNPFATGGGLPEIYAWGLRNPWRFSFDPETGDLWVGDVGQGQVEEVDIVRNGGNYGWNIMEGDQCYPPTAGCNDPTLELPVATTFHSDGDNCVIGGVVYRGSAIPDLVGAYLWGDNSSGRLYGLFSDPYTGAPQRSLLNETGLAITHIGTDADGEVIVVARFSGLYRVSPASPPKPDTFPADLAATGCFDASGEPLPMMIPFEIAHPFWSDGAEKQRWLAIPDGTAIHVDDRGELVFPVGTILAKAFELGGKKVETRLFLRHDDGGWAGYAYLWDDDQAAATLLASSNAATGGGGESWTVPSRSDCLRCHNLAAGGTLSPSLMQLDIDRTQSNGWVENEIDELVRLEMLVDPGSRPGAFPAVDDGSVDLETRARAYLEVNCAICHLPGGPGGGDLDLRYDTPLASSGMCGAPNEGDLGIAGARIIDPGDPARSILSARVHRRDVYGMPPLASTVVDAVGAELLDDWIAALATCP